MSSPPPHPLFLFKLSPTIPRAHLVAMLGNLRSTPPTHPDPSDATFPFVEIDGATKDAVKTFLKNEPGLIIPLPFPSAKTIEGKLGLGHKMMVAPPHDAYPVPYLLYGALAGGGKLGEVLGIEKEVFALDAVVRDGRVRVWKGEQQALVDCEGRRDVRGKLYVVKSVVEEDKLRECWGSHFEVVRCAMEFEGRYEVAGLTFRYCGPEEHLV